MTTDTKTDVGRRMFLKASVWLPLIFAAGTSSGCALPTLMKAQARKAVPQDHFSCGENCPHAVKESKRTRNEH